MNTATPTPPKAGRREWIGLSVLMLACILYVMDLTVLHLAIPSLSADLKPSSAQLLWIIDIYGFFVAGSLITMGTLGDRFGRRRLLLIGAAAFGAVSVLAAFSTSAEMLIASRALLGIAGATLAPSTLSLIRNMFLDEKQRMVAVSIWITSFSVGAAIGPILGGVVLEYFWWGSVFLLAVPVMALLLVIGPKLLPEYKDPAAGFPDIPSAALSIAAVLAVIFGLKDIAQDGLSWLPVLGILAGLALGAAFVRRQLTLADPFLDLRLFRIPAFSASIALYNIGVFISFGGFLFLPQYLQLVLDMSPLEAGLWTLPWALAFVVGSQVTPRLVRRIRPAYIMSAGLLLGALGVAIYTQFDTSSNLTAFVIASIIFSLGTAPLFILTIDLVIGFAPPERAGAAAGMSETGAEFGGALGIAIFGSIGVALYRNKIDDTLPAGVPPESAVVARDTLGGALDVAARLPVQLGDELIRVAREAYIPGLQVVSAISSIGLVILAIGTFFLLRHVPARPDHPTEPSPDPSPTPATTPSPLPTPTDVSGGGS